MSLLPRAIAAHGASARDDAVDDVVLLGLFGAHEVVAIGVLRDLLERLARVVGDDLVEPAADVDDLAGVDLDVGGLALEAAGDLVDQDLGVGQRHALAGGAARQQQRAHAHRDADADRLHVGLDELHRVVDREAGVDAAAGRVDVEADVLVGVLGLEVQELGDDQVGDVLRDGRAEEDDALVEQPGVDVERALPAGGLLDDHRDEWAHGARFVFAWSARFLPGPPVRWRLPGRSGESSNRPRGLRKASNRGFDACSDVHRSVASGA